MSQGSLKSVSFDGTNDYINITTYVNMSPTDAVTMEAWIRGDMPSGNGFIYDRIEVNDGFGLVVTNTGNLRLTINGGLQLATTSAIVTDGLWHHVAGTYDRNAGMMYVYIDGVVQDSAVYASLITYSPEPRNSIGGPGPGSVYFNGEIDEVRIWNLARTSSEISSYKDSCLQGDETGLIAYWKLEEGSGTLAADLTLNGNNGTLVNGAIWNDTVPCIFCANSYTDTITVYDTTIVYDTTFVTIYDTTFVTSYDTVIVYDSIAVTDTLVIDVIISVGPPIGMNTIKVYPNPTKDQVIIHTGNFSSMTNYSIKIINSLSQEVFNSTINQQTFTIDISQFGSTGLYYIQILDPGLQVVETRKIVLE